MRPSGGRAIASVIVVASQARASVATGQARAGVVAAMEARARSTASGGAMRASAMAIFYQRDQVKLKRSEDNVPHHCCHDW